MARLIDHGTLAAAVSVVEQPAPGWTMAAVRDVLGTRPGESVSYPIPRGGFLFCRVPSPSLVGAFRPNMRASFLCGYLIYGPALAVGPGEKIIWHHDGPLYRPDRVISGGQTGADRAALVVAKSLGIPTGGTMPRGFLAHDGPRPEFAALYGVAEHASDRYPPRTEANVKAACVTLAFATVWNSPGEVLTRRLCAAHGKPLLAVTPGGPVKPADAAAWLAERAARVVNVAGNSEGTAPGIGRAVELFLLALLAPRRK